MTAEKACLELLTFSECHPTPIDEFFLAGFWILVLAAAFTTATFFKCRWLKTGGRRVVRWLAVILGSLATMLFLSLTILCWTIHRLVGSVTEPGGASENARAVYSCFTGIAFLSVVSWGITRQHKLDKTCDKCYGTAQNSSESSARIVMYPADAFPLPPRDSWHRKSKRSMQVPPRDERRGRPTASPPRI